MNHRYALLPRSPRPANQNLLVGLIILVIMLSARAEAQKAAGDEPRDSAKVALIRQLLDCYHTVSSNVETRPVASPAPPEADVGGCAE
jgi:hypothetical protein